MILHRYFARRFLMIFAGIFGLFFAMVFLVDIVDQVRRFTGEEAGFGELVQLTLLNIPQALYLILPLMMILAAIALFLGLARSSELVVTRAAGRSALVALIAPIMVALLIGLVGVAVFNPIVAATSREYEARLADLRGTNAALALSDDGLWLRQGDGAVQTVIHAGRSNLDGTELSDVTFITFSEDGTPLERIEAAGARLADRAWDLTDAKVWPLDGAANPEVSARQYAALSVSSTLTADQIRDSFGVPSSIPIWELPSFIARLQEAGFTARRHQMYLQSELALPAFLVAMVLIAAGFTMRHQRGGRTGILVLGAILLSFAVYFLRNLSIILGETGQIPIVLAAWAPPLIAIGMALGLLLHLEDG
jgi:lipopolysaccharide export system permease protein